VNSHLTLEDIVDIELKQLYIHVLYMNYTCGNTFHTQYSLYSCIYGSAGLGTIVQCYSVLYPS